MNILQDHGIPQTVCKKSVNNRSALVKVRDLERVFIKAEKNKIMVWYTPHSGRNFQAVFQGSQSEHFSKGDRDGKS